MFNIAHKTSTLSLPSRSLSSGSRVRYRHRIRQLSNHHEEICFRYLQDIDLYRRQKPYAVMRHASHTDAVRLPTNLVWKQEAQQQITDIRGRESDFELDIHGFAVRYWPTRLSNEDLDDSNVVRDLYLPEVYDLLKSAVTKPDVIMIAHFQRRQLAKGHPRGSHPHVDVSPYHVYHYLRERFGYAAERLLAGRVQVFNTWRPTFDEVIVDEPLALCDGSTIDESSLIECTHIDHDGKRTFNLHSTYDENSRWYYLNRQTKDEVWIFKHFDSADCAARVAPHATFRHSSVPVEYVPRETVETLVYVFTYPEKQASESEQSSPVVS